MPTKSSPAGGANAHGGFRGRGSQNENENAFFWQKVFREQATQQPPGSLDVGKETACLNLLLKTLTISCARGTTLRNGADSHARGETELSRCKATVQVDVKVGSINEYWLSRIAPAKISAMASNVLTTRCLAAYISD
jgi:hypothetical protein